MKRINHIILLIVRHLNAELIVNACLFFSAFFLYLKTLSPTASLWDCGEFILCSANLEVGHPSGAPFYWLLGRIFSLFASDNSQIAWWCNLISALASAFTISIIFSLFRFILIRIFGGNHRILIICSAAIAAATFAVTDTFWYSAVEAEVYALSTCFSMIILFATTKWINAYETHEIYSSRWLFLIALLLGISVGIHIEGLLIIPFLALIISIIIGYRRFWHLILAFALGCFAFFIIYKIFIFNTIDIAAIAELFFVNTFKLPYNSGLIFTFGAIFAILFALLFITRRSTNQLIHLAIGISLCFFIGYSSYATIIIRANARPTINLCTPDDVYNFEAYLNRDIYGSSSLIRGPWYGSTPSGIKYAIKWTKSAKGGYDSSETPTDFSYEYDQLTWFPRMNSNQSHHLIGYQQWTDVDVENYIKPTFSQELKYTLKYQLNYMYFRYLLWNFVGRQNDIQGYGDAICGNWISGIKFIDNYLGQRDIIHPDETNNKARTCYFMIPFIIGIIGLCVGFANKKVRHITLSILVLFLISGPILTLYLNQQPFEPRERDYVYIISFIAFSAFICIGIYSIINIIEKFFGRYTSILAIIAFTISLPILLLIENYTSHNRSGRTFDTDIAKSILRCCAPNAILFTNADNDTYPLWYVQEVENFRTDVSVINYGLLGADWYVKNITLNKSNKIKSNNSSEKILIGNDAFDDIIVSNSDAPIYTTDLSINNYSESDSSIVKQGLIYRIKNKAIVDDKPLSELFLLKTKIPSASTYYQSYDVLSVLTMMNYRLFANQAAQQSIADGDSETAKDVLHKLLSEWPVTSATDDMSNIVTAQLLYQAGDYTYCRQVLQILTQYYIDILAYYVEISKYDLRKAQIGIDNIQAFGNELLSILSETQNTDLRQALISYFESWDLN